jgi:hydrogenase maturation protein HypF
MNAEVRAAPRVEGRRFEVTGVVQGVGFRPQVVRLARAQGLTGAVRNVGTAAVIEAYGPGSVLREFEARLQLLAGGGLRVDGVRTHSIDVPADTPAGFDIAKSLDALPSLGVAPDWVICTACTNETLDPFNRRYRYPFTACTECGPRLSVFLHPPYDRARTSMAQFPLCEACGAEYGNPDDRRFHAQATACHACGPRASLRRLDNRAFSLDALTSLDEVDAATTLIGKGEIILVKGLGGLQLACDATNADAVARLRAAKRRDGKPFALLMRDVDMLRQWCEPDEAAEAMLAGAAGPIVLMPRRAPSADVPALAEGVAPGLSSLGVMLPPTALHHLLMRRRRAPVVLTSGNLSAEPQAITCEEAAAKFDGVVNFVLDHNRAIARRLDDSVGRFIGGEFRIMRRARGFAPAPIPLPPGFDSAIKVLALGGDLKNTFALLQDGQGVVSQHMGDLHDAACLADQQRALHDYLAFYRFEPDVVARDAHPGYAASPWAQDRYASRVVTVQHHHAHIAACLGEHGWPLHGGKVLGIALDGIGMGEGGALWGGEFLLADYRDCERVGTFKPVPLLGGDLAAREPWRNTYAHLMVEMGWARFAMNFEELELFRFLGSKPRELLDGLLGKPALAPPASSAGRLFDAVAAAIGICRDGVSYEGEAATRMEAMIGLADLQEDAELDYPFAIPRLDKGKGLPYIEPLAMWQALLGDLILATPPARMAARFHRGLAKTVVRMATQLCEKHAVSTVALGGGVFQNRIFSELVLEGLAAAGLPTMFPTQMPANDGGLAWGQGLVAMARHHST